MTKIIFPKDKNEESNEAKWERFKKDDTANLSDIADFVTIINRVYELQGKKVNYDVCNTIANRIMKDGFSLEQLENAERIMSGHRFVQLGYPEFLQFLPSRNLKDEIFICGLCGEQREENGNFFSQGMLPTLCVKKNDFGGISVSETRILCSCEQGKKSQRLWAAMPMFDKKKIFKASHRWYFVFTMDDPIWLDKMFKIKEYLREEITPMTNLDSEIVKDHFEKYFDRAEKEIAQDKAKEKSGEKINLISAFQKLVDDTLTT
jgi:hypothetical protein